MKFEYNGFAKSGGIYQIKNTKNGKVYIGSAACFQVRWAQHKKSLVSGKHGNKHMQSAYNLEGDSVWEFTVLEVVAGDKASRQTAEQVWIDKFYGENCYNLKKNASPSREDIPSKDPAITKAKLSESSKRMWQNEEYRQARIIQLNDPIQRANQVEKVTAWSEDNKEFLIQSGKEVWNELVNDSVRYESYKEAASIRTKESWKDPAVREKRISAHSNPEVRKLMSDKKKQQLLDNPEYYAAAKKLLNENRSKAHAASTLTKKKRMEKILEENPNYFEEKKAQYKNNRKERVASMSEEEKAKLREIRRNRRLQKVQESLQLTFTSNLPNQ